jgi:hypothetical protein
MNNEYLIADVVEIGSAKENILFNPAKEGPEPDEPGLISRPTNDDD